MFHQRLIHIGLSLNLHPVKKISQYIIVSICSIACAVLVLCFLLPTSCNNGDNDRVGSDMHTWEQDISEEIFLQLHSNPHRARELAQKTLKTLKPDQLQIEVELLKHIGSTYALETNFAEALRYYAIALKKAEAIDYEEQIADIHNNIGGTNFNVKNYKVAMIHFTEALNYYQKAGNELKKAGALNNLGSLYHELGNLEKAKKSFEAALLSKIHIKDTIGMTAVLNNIALIYLDMGKPVMALQYLDESIKQAYIIDNQYGLCNSYENLGRVYLAMDKPVDAIAAYSISRNMATEINQPYHYAHATLGIAKAQLLLNNSQIALSLTDSVMQMADEASNLFLKNETHLVLSNIYKHTGDYKNSLEQYVLYVETNGQLLNQSIIHQIYDFELSNLSQANMLQQMEIEKKELAINKKNYLLLYTTVIFILTVAGLYLIYSNHRNRQHVKLQQTIIELTEKKSHAAVNAEIQERKRIGQDLHDGLGQLLSVAGLNISVLQNKKTLTEERRSELLELAMRSVNEAFTEVRNISHNLAPSLLSERGLEGALKNLSDQVNKTSKLQFTCETFGLNGMLNSIEENTLFRAAQEILNNTIKHSNAEKLSMQVAQGNSEITLMAEDDGYGFDIKDISFKDGNGLTNMKTRIENLNGSLHIDSAPGRGTIVSIVIPLKFTDNVKPAY